MPADLFILFGALRDGELETYGERLAAPLRAQGLGVDFCSMGALESLPEGCAAIPLLAWNYHFDAPLWRERLAMLSRLPVKLPNSASLLAWNTDKIYLRDLAGRGAPIVPTLFRDRVTSRDTEAARASFGVDTIVVKPTISAGSKETLKLGPNDLLIGAPKGAAMIQPFLPAIQQEGELSLIFVGGAFSHALWKRAAAGDYRIQSLYGGTEHAVQPDPRDLARAEAVMAMLPFDQAPLYARIDMVRGLDGELALIEAELIEPYLYPLQDDRFGVRFAGAVLQRLGH